MDKAAIEAVLPHRDPMLLIDEVTRARPGERVVARKTVTEEDCAGHFPGNPIMPGVKMVEALAQCGAVAVLSQEENRGKLALFAGIDDVRFKRVVRPGDVLTLECVVETVRGPVGRGKVRATVDGAARRARDAHVRGRRRQTPSDRQDERQADLDHGARGACARARADERRPLEAGRHERRVDPASAPGSASGGSPPTTRRSPTSAFRPPASARDGGRRAVVDRPAHRRDRHARHGVSVLERADRPTRSACPTRRPTTSRPAAPGSSTRSPRPTRCSPPACPSARSSSAATCCRRSSTGPTARRSFSSATVPARS